MKPRIKHLGRSWWVCTDYQCTGLGVTPKEAYEHWFQAKGRERERARIDGIRRSWPGPRPWWVSSLFSVGQGGRAS